MKKIIGLFVAFYLIWLAPQIGTLLEDLCPALITALPYLSLGFVGLVIFKLAKNGTSYF